MEWKEILILIIYSLLLAGIIAIIIFREKIFERIEKPRKAKQPSERVQKILQKYFKEKDVQKKELEKFELIEAMKTTVLDEIETKSTEMTEKAEATLKVLDPDEHLIEQGGKMYTQFSIGLENAFPRDEKERVKDMGDLMDAISVLEGLDKTQYEQDEKDDTGRGMYFDQITSKLNRAMGEVEFVNEKVFVFDKLVNLGLQTIKNVTRKDLHEALNFMKEAAYIGDFVAINPELTLISKYGDIPSFSKSETVVLALAYEEHPLSHKSLLSQTKWSEHYANSVINGLIEKEMASLLEDQIIITGFETQAEKGEREELEKQIEEKQKEKARKREERKRLLEQELRGSPEPEEVASEEMIEEKPEVIIFEAAASKEVIEEKPEEIASKELIEEELEEVASEEVVEEEPEKIASEEVTEEDFANISGSDFVGDDSDEELSNEAIIDGIMTIFENYEHINGGLMDVRLIQRLLSELYPDVTIEQILATIDSQMEMGLIQQVLGFPGVTVLLFKEIVMDEDMIALLGSIVKNGWMDKTQIGEILSWDEERTLNVMKRLQDVEVLRLDEKNRVVIPGLFIE